MKAVRRSIGAGASAVEEDVAHLWERVSEEMEEHFHLQLSVGEEDGSPNWSAAHRRIEEKVEEATAAALRELHLRDQLGGLFARRSRVIWGFIFSAILTALGGVILTMLEMRPWNAIVFAGASLLLALGAFVGAQSVKKAREFYTDVLEKHRAILSQKQRKAFAEGTADFYHDFVGLFEPLRNVCREHRERYEPQLRVIEGTEKTLMELERILSPVEKALSSRK
jgi:hypothetical protein